MAKKPKIAAAKAHTAEPVKNLAAKPKTASKAKAPRAKAAASKRMHNSHSDVAERMLQLAQFLSQDPEEAKVCLLYTSPSPRDLSTSRMPSSA